MSCEPIIGGVVSVEQPVSGYIGIWIAGLMLEQKKDSDIASQVSDHDNEDGL